nr:integrase, catalytic region, zinc finger, CCHC-type, peptidase aspartic, catalytic [Tanacetum cinerariifolium]
MHADLKYVESLEKEIDELESNNAEFSDMYDVILQECVSKDVMCSYLMSLSDLDALDELQCLYLHKVKECDCLAQKLSNQTEFVNKEVHNELSQHFAKLEKHSVSLELALQKHLKAQLQDKNIAISELKKLTKKGKGKSVDTKFDRPSVIRQPNAQRIPKPSVLGKPAPFSYSLERIYFPTTKSVPKTNVLEGLSKPVTAQTLPQTTRKADPICQLFHCLLTLVKIVQLILFIVDSGCTKNMTGNLKFLCNFVEKFLGTVRFGNDQFAPILGYGYLVQGNVTINRVYYVEGLNHNLFSVGQFCDADLEVAFKISTCFVRDLQGNDLLTGTKFLNKTLNAFFKEEGIEHQTSTARTPEQNSIVKRRNRTLVEATHGKNLDKMKEKGDPCILVGYSTQSKGYHVCNKRTRMIVESIHIRFDEIKEVSEMSVANDTSGLIPKRQKASDYDNPDLIPQRQDVFSLADADVSSQQELDLFFGPLYDEFFNAGSNPQDKQPSKNIQSTSAPSTPTYVHYNTPHF